MDQGLVYVCLVIIGLVIVIYLSKCILVVPARKFAVLESMGTFKRLLLPGVHFIFLFQNLRRVSWSFYNQQNRLVHQTLDIFSFDAVALDVPVVSCITADKMQVGLDGIASYRISDLQKAVYESADTLAHFNQVLLQGIRNVISRTPSQALYGGVDVSIGDAVASYVNEMMTRPTDYGIRCVTFVIQKIDMDKTILDQNQKILSQRNAQELMLMQRNAEHELALKQLGMKRKEQQERHAMELSDEHAKTAVKREEAVRQRAMHEDFYDKVGLGGDKYLELKRIEAQKDMFGNAQKVVMAPLEWFNAPRVQLQRQDTI